MRVDTLSFRLALFIFIVCVAISLVYAVSLHAYTHLNAHEMAKKYLASKAENLAYNMPENTDTEMLDEYAAALNVDYAFICVFNPPYEAVTELGISSGADRENLKKLIARRFMEGFKDAVFEGTVTESAAEINGGETSYFIAHRQFWKSADIYAGVILNKNLYTREITGHYTFLIFIFICFPPVFGIAGYFLGRMIEKPSGLLALQLKNLSAENAAINRENPDVAREITLIREQVLRAHYEHNLVWQRYEEKRRDIGQIKKEMEQNAYNRSVLLEANLENLRINKLNIESKRELTERIFIYQTGYMIGGNLIDEALREVISLFSEITQNLSSGAFLKSAENIKQAEKYLEQFQFLFEPFYFTEFSPLEVVIEEARNLTQMVLKRCRAKVNSYTAETIARLSVCREISKIAAAVSCVLLNAADSPPENPEIIIDVSAAGGADHKVKESAVPPVAGEAFPPDRETYMILINFELKSGGFNDYLPRTEETFKKSEKLDRLAEALPGIVQALLKGSFTLYKNGNTPMAEIRIWEMP
jgi:hypothetical protein